MIFPPRLEVDEVVVVEDVHGSDSDVECVFLADHSKPPISSRAVPSWIAWLFV